MWIVEIKDLSKIQKRKMVKDDIFEADVVYSDRLEHTARGGRDALNHRKACTKLSVFTDDGREK